MSNEASARTNVLLEEIKASVGVIADGHKGLTGSMHALNAKVDGLTEDMGIVKVRLGKIESDVSILKGDVGDVKVRLDGVEGRLGRVEGRLGRIEHHVGLNGTSAPDKKRSSVKRRPRAKR